MKRLSIAALQQRQFKAPVTALLPGETLKDGVLQYESLHFMGVFRSIPADEARANLKRIEELRHKASLDEVLIESVRQTKSYIVGIEKHPDHEWPFADAEGQDAVITPEAIEQLLNVREVRDAIEKTYADARSGELLAKNSRT